MNELPMAAGLADPLTSHLYQLPQDSGPTDQFVGAHGFTGLNYVITPTAGPNCNSGARWKSKENPQITQIFTDYSLNL